MARRGEATMATRSGTERDSVDVVLDAHAVFRKMLDRGNPRQADRPEARREARGDRDVLRTSTRADDAIDSRRRFDAAGTMREWISRPTRSRR